MKRFFQTFVITGVVALFGAGAVLAGPTDDPGIKARERNQQRRIDQGVQSGQLTPGEAGKLEAEQAKIKQNEARMKADGKLTKKERRKLHKEQNRASKHIYTKKHNRKKVNVN